MQLSIPARRVQMKKFFSVQSWQRGPLDYSTEPLLDPGRGTLQDAREHAQKSTFWQELKRSLARALTVASGLGRALETCTSESASFKFQVAGADSGSLASHCGRKLKDKTATESAAQPWATLEPTYCPPLIARGSVQDTDTYGCHAQPQHEHCTIYSNSPFLLW